MQKSTPAKRLTVMRAERTPRKTMLGKFSKKSDFLMPYPTENTMGGSRRAKKISSEKTTSRWTACVGEAVRGGGRAQ